MKVDFIILGAAKCGTTTLYRILKDHPDINFCREKEPDFFSKTEDWKTHLADYHKLFREEEGKIYGEASHSYTAYPRFNLNIWEDIHAYNPGMKFIYIVRDPVDRFISSYMQDYQRGRISFSVSEAVHQGRSLMRSRYYTQIKPFIDTFGREKVMIIEFEDLADRQEKVLEALSGFLGINAGKFRFSGPLHANVSLKGEKLPAKYDGVLKLGAPVLRLLPESWKARLRNYLTPRHRTFDKKPELTTAEKEAIINFTRLDILALSELTGKDLSKWLEIK